LKLNATRGEILDELNKLIPILTPNDNLLVYYAGHGEYDRVNNQANWLPVDADRTSNTNWIPNRQLTDIWNIMSAKHILVVADSCYSGAMTRSSMVQLEPGLSEEERVNQLKAFAKLSSRTVLTSGGVKPVMDGGADRHSIFAKNFIDILSENQDYLLGRQLSNVLSARVLNKALKMEFDQRPEYAPIRFAIGDSGSGDFIFQRPKT
jgi:hypothetical protein